MTQVTNFILYTVSFIFNEPIVLYEHTYIPRLSYVY